MKQRLNKGFRGLILLTHIPSSVCSFAAKREKYKAKKERITATWLRVTLLLFNETFKDKKYHEDQKEGFKKLIRINLQQLTVRRLPAVLFWGQAQKKEKELLYFSS